MENGDRVNVGELRAFLGDKQFGGGEKLVKDLDKRVIFMFSKSQVVFKFNLSMLSIMQDSD